MGHLWYVFRYVDLFVVQFVGKGFPFLNILVMLLVVPDFCLYHRGEGVVSVLKSEFISGRNHIYIQADSRQSLKTNISTTVYTGD